MMPLVKFSECWGGWKLGGRGVGGQWLDQLVWQTHELCPELVVTRLGLGLRGGQLSWGAHGVEKWLSPWFMELPDKYCVVLGTQQSSARMLLIEEAGRRWHWRRTSDKDTALSYILRSNDGQNG